MKILSLFDGCSTGMKSSIDAGLKVDNYYASEIDEYAIKVSKRNWKNVIQIGDVRNINSSDYKDIDLLIGGSPCQSFSRAGRCNGMSIKENVVNNKIISLEQYIELKNNGAEFDGYSYLLWEYIRILKEVKPKYFLLENVEMDKFWRDIITKAIGVEPVLINSKLLSAQNRPRLYWTNICKLNQPEDKGIYLKDILLDFNKEDLIEYKGLLVDKSFNKNELSLIDVVDGEVRIKQATKKGYIIAEDGDGVNLSFPTSKTRRGRVIKQKSNTLDRQCNVCVYYDGIIRRLTIEELEKLQTLPVGYTRGIPMNKRKSVIGNGWTADVITYILNHIK